jgi:hypothetical protein
MCNPTYLLFFFLRSWFQSRLQLQAEIVALRHQIGVLRRSQPGRVHLCAADRLFWVWLTRLWSGWPSALAIVKPATVISWHRQGFRLYCGWRSGRGRAGRPTVSQEVRGLIRKISLANVRWGAHRIHGDCSNSESRCRNPRGQVLGSPTQTAFSNVAHPSLNSLVQGCSHLPPWAAYAL